MANDVKYFQNSYFKFHYEQWVHKNYKIKFKKKIKIKQNAID